MANYIKIPLANNPPRSFVTGAVDGPFTWEDAVGTISAGAASAAQPLVGGSGSGATATVAASGTALGDLTVTIVGTGEGYKVGDVITIAALTSGGATEWTEPLQFTVAAGDLVASEGSSTNEYYLVDVDTVITVDYNFSVNNQMRIWTNEVSGTSFNAPSLITLQFDDTPATNDGKIGQDLSEAIIKAIEAPNSVPTVEFTDDVELLSIDLS